MQILEAAWAHNEALQTTELPLVAQAISRAMLLTLTPSSAASRPVLALLPTRLLSALSANLAALGEARLVPELARQGVWALLPSHLSAVATSPCDPIRLQAGCAGVAGLMGSEEFALVRVGLLKGAGKGVGVPVADGAVAKLVGAEGGALPADVAAHADACASLATGPAAAALGLAGDAALRRRLRSLLDYCDAVGRAVKR
jgi:hypothetical protein